MRRHPILACLAVSLLSGFSPVIFAADPVAPAPTTPAAAENSDVAFAGVINEDDVYVRSGPAESFYATTKLNKGTAVNVVGTRGDWVKVVPPEGSFCYVAKAYVEKRGDGSVGRTTKADLLVRAGSELNGNRTTVETSLPQGTDVKILGEQSEWVKIAPPDGVFYYVKKSYVNPAPTIVDADTHKAKPAATNPPANNPDNTSVAQTQSPQPQPPLQPQNQQPQTPTQSTTSSPTLTQVSQPAAGTNAQLASAVQTHIPQSSIGDPGSIGNIATTMPAMPVMVTPTTKPVEESAQTKFNNAETAFLDAARLPLLQQPLDQLLTQYTELSNDNTLGSAYRQIADQRIKTIKVRCDLRDQYASAQKLQEEADDRQKSLQAEHKELIDRVKELTVTSYAAIGTLRVSSLQQTGGTLYRLTDPNTGRTLVYIKTNDAKYAGMLDQFIGVNGDITEDATTHLKILTPSDVTTVDQAKVNQTVTATLLPPSLVAKNSTASTGN